ncbi:hypothetical protein TWF192_010444 [Orbilia oligospora]|nr:hypothetical protein TWF192_010444 [Orbilia oligospora]
MDSLHLTRFLNIYRDLLFGRRGESFPVTLSWHGEGLMNEMMVIGFFRVRASGKGNMVSGRFWFLVLQSQVHVHTGYRRFPPDAHRISKIAKSLGHGKSHYVDDVPLKFRVTQTFKGY